MKEIEWDDSLNIGVKLIDEQHMQLIRIVNSLIRALNGHADKEAVNDILTKLREYTVFHFNAEEAFMEEIGYPGRGNQVQEHKKLKNQVKGFRYAMFHGQDVTLLDIRSVVSEWLLNHILKCDIKIAEFMRQKESREVEQKNCDEAGEAQAEIVKDPGKVTNSEESGQD